VARLVGPAIADEFRVYFERRRDLDLMGTARKLALVLLTALLFMVEGCLISAVAFSCIVLLSNTYEACERSHA